MALHTRYINDAKYKETHYLTQDIDYVCSDYVSAQSGQAKFYISTNNPVQLVDGTLLFFDSNDELGSVEFLDCSELYD